MHHGIRAAWLGLLTAVLCCSAGAQNAPPPAAPADAPAAVTPDTATTTLPPQSTSPSAEPQGSAPLRVMVGKSLLINTSERLKRISVTDPAVADALVVTPTQVLVHGRTPGEVSLLIWDELERSRAFDLRVDVDVTAAADELHRIFPDEVITVSPSRNAMVLNGHVSTEDVAKRAGLIGEAYSKNVVNVLTFGPMGAQEVLLEVKFAEVDRSALNTIGFNLLSTGAGNVLGNITTAQFGSTTIGPITDHITTPPTPYPDIPTPITSAGTVAFPSTTTVGNLLNMFLFSPELHLGAVVQALQARNLLQILAEPNLIAVNGKEASFLAGGEFPFPVAQPSGQGLSTVTIQFRELGVRLKFTPVIQPNGNIHLRVVPEVSTLDFTNAVTVAGTTVPAISTRKADTEFELQDGQSFVIAGLLDNRVTNIASKVPWLGDVPVLGNFFKSKAVQKSRGELMVFCTARRVSPSNQAPAGPVNPQPLLDEPGFDGKKPEGTNRKAWSP